MSAKNILVFSLILFLVSPILILFIESPHIELTRSSEVFWVLKNTITQAFLSSTLALVFGFWGALGLLSLQNKYFSKWMIEVVILLPNVLPSLFLILAILKVINPFPFGVTGLVIAHVFLNIGPVAISLARILPNKLGQISELAWVEGAKSAQFWFYSWKIILSDLLSLWTYVFILCFTSFSIPMVLAGDKGTTLEVLIFEKIRLEQNWGQALGIAFLQIGILFLFATLPTKISFKKASSRHGFPYAKRSWGILPPLIISAILLYALTEGFLKGFSELAVAQLFNQELFFMALRSLIMGISVGLLVLFFLQVILFCSPSFILRKFLISYVAPGSALTALAFWLIGDSHGLFGYAKLILSLSLISLPILYRLAWRQEVDGLQGQVQTAQTLGAKPLQIWQEITGPQGWQVACRLAGFASLWAIGDFAMSRILLYEKPHLGLIIEGLTNSYRLAAATTLCWLMIIIGFISYAFFWGISHVRSRKLI